MDELLTPDKIEVMADALGLSMRELCKRADISPSTFWRWRAGTLVPSIAVYQRLVSVVSQPQGTAND